MKARVVGTSAGVALMGALLSLLPDRVEAQVVGGGGTLGGFGAMAEGPGSTMGAGPVIPFGGRFAAAVPSTMAGSGALSFRPRPSASPSGGRPAFTVGPSGGMAGGMGPGRRPFALQGPGPSGGLGWGDAVRRRMPATGKVGVMPPSFGSPFRRPSSLAAPTTAGAGMPM